MDSVSSRNGALQDSVLLSDASSVRKFKVLISVSIALTAVINTIQLIKIEC